MILYNLSSILNNKAWIIENKVQLVIEDGDVDKGRGDEGFGGGGGEGVGGSIGGVAAVRRRPA